MCVITICLIATLKTAGMQFVNMIEKPPMNWVDIILIGIILLAIIAGWQKGFIRGLLGLAAWTGSLTAAYFFHPLVAEGLQHIVYTGVWSLPLAFIITTVAARLLIGVIIMGITNTLPQSTEQNSFNKVMGIVPGAIFGLVCAVIVAAFMLLLPLKDDINEQVQKSYIASELSKPTDWANKKLEPVFSAAIEESTPVTVIHPKPDETVILPFSYDEGKPRPSLEADMLVLINKERTRHGLKPLVADEALRKVARAHSQDMLSRSYFAHKNPDGQSPFDRLEQAKINFRTAGENLALAQTLEAAHTNLMKSPGHRANILNKSFGKVGIGIIDAGKHGLMITQEFKD